MKKAILLARVSTKRQEDEGLSLKKIQVPKLKEYAHENDLTIVKEFIFQESADHKIRKKFNEMIAYMRKHKDVKAIVSYRVDRITRNYRDAVAMDDLRLEYDKELHFVYDRLIIHRKSVGRDITDWDTKVYLAKQFLNRLKEDAVNTAKYKLSRGELPGPAKFGYQNTELEDGRKWVIPDPFKSQILLSIFEWYASASFSMLEIYKKIKSEYDYNLSKSRICDILKDPFYRGDEGQIMYDGKEYPHQYDEVVSKELFDKAQVVRESRGKKRFKYAGKPFLYRGLLTCSTCGCTITPEEKHKKLVDGSVNRHVYYHCTQYNGKHGASWLTEDDLTEQFAALFEGMHIPKDELEDIVNTLKQAHKDKSHNHRQMLTHHQGEYDKYENRIERMYEDYLDGSITKDYYEQKRKEYRAKQKQHLEKINRLQFADEQYYLTVSYLVELASRAKELFLRSEPTEKRQLLKLVLRNQKLEGKKVRYSLNYPFDKVLFYANRSAWLRASNSNKPASPFMIAPTAPTAAVGKD